MKTSPVWPCFLFLFFIFKIRNKKQFCIILKNLLWWSWVSGLFRCFKRLMYWVHLGGFRPWFHSDNPQTSSLFGVFGPNPMQVVTSSNPVQVVLDLNFARWYQIGGLNVIVLKLFLGNNFSDLGNNFIFLKPRKNKKWKHKGYQTSFFYIKDNLNFDHLLNLKFYCEMRLWKTIHVALFMIVALWEYVFIREFLFFRRVLGSISHQQGLEVRQTPHQVKFFGTLIPSSFKYLSS